MGQTLLLVILGIIGVLFYAMSQFMAKYRMRTEAFALSQPRISANINIFFGLYIMILGIYAMVMLMSSGVRFSEKTPATVNNDDSIKCDQDTTNANKYVCNAFNVTYTDTKANKTVSALIGANLQIDQDISGAKTVDIYYVPHDSDYYDTNPGEASLIQDSGKWIVGLIIVLFGLIFVGIGTLGKHRQNRA
tara:strand:- start:315 stop:887 length:573 start_codon:yes stop_codon:yes gene_type:complete